MAINIQIPKELEAIEYFTSFAPAFFQNNEMRAALLGVRDSLRQADLIPLEPLGMFACITAEEEAATFLYFALLHKGYAVSKHGKLRQHADKVKFVVFAQALLSYFFGNGPVGVPRAVRIDRDGERPKTTHLMEFGEYVLIQEDPLETVVVIGEGEPGHSLAVEKAVDDLLAEVTPKGMTVKSYIKNLANRRNLCLYGDPERKPKFQSDAEIAHFRSNCISMIVLGFLVFNGKGRTSSIAKLVESVFSKISA